MKTYVVYTARKGSPPESVFAFHARSLSDAESMKIRWTRYQGMLPSEFGVEENPNYREGGCGMRDDYVDHSNRSHFLDFYLYQHSDDPHPVLAECHLITKKMSGVDISDLLTQVSETIFDGRRFDLHNTFNLSSTTEDGRCIVVMKR